MVIPSIFNLEILFLACLCFSRLKKIRRVFLPFLYPMRPRTHIQALSMNRSSSCDLRFSSRVCSSVVRCSLLHMQLILLIISNCLDCFCLESFFPTLIAHYLALNLINSHLFMGERSNSLIKTINYFISVQNKLLSRKLMLFVCIIER